MARGRTAQDNSVLEMALVGYEIERQKIDEKIAEIRAKLGGSKGPGRPAAAPKATGRKKRVLSPEARERIALAQKKRWAKHRRAKKAA